MSIYDYNSFFKSRDVNKGDVDKLDGEYFSSMDKYKRMPLDDYNQLVEIAESHSEEVVTDFGMCVALPAGEGLSGGYTIRGNAEFADWTDRNILSDEFLKYPEGCDSSSPMHLVYIRYEKDGTAAIMVKGSGVHDPAGTGRTVDQKFGFKVPEEVADNIEWEADSGSEAITAYLTGLAAKQIELSTNKKAADAFKRSTGMSFWKEDSYTRLVVDAREVDRKSYVTDMSMGTNYQDR